VFPVTLCSRDERRALELKEGENRTDIWQLADVALAVWLGAYAFVFLVSEALSASGVFKPGWIRTIWLIVAFGGGGGAWHTRKKWYGVVVALWRTARLPRTFVGWCIFVAGTLTLICALLAPTSAQDALVYHFPRALHWLVNGSTDFYETAIARQNFQAQGFSLCVAHLLAVCGNDRLVNLLQWCAWWLFAGVSGLAAAELARENGDGGMRCCWR
jgi:hypothetical protein